MVSEISIVICVYTEKRWNEIDAAVASAKSQTLPPKDIIVVVDYNPALLQRAQEHFSDVVVIENHGDKGLSGARNTGWTTAQGEIVAFLDDDAIAEPDWLENLAACYSDPETAGVGGKIIPLWQTRPPSWFPDEFNWVIGCTYRGLPTRIAPIRNVIGANMSIRKTILTAVGGFRESFGCDRGSESASGSLKWFQNSAGDEETELCIRVSQQLPNSRWLYAPAAIVRHQVSAQRTRWSYFLSRCYDEGLGKAHLVKLHDANTGLASERTYTLQILPMGVVRGLVKTLFGLDPSGIASASAIVCGLAATTAGYLVGSIASRITDFRGAALTSASYRSTAVPPPVNIQ
ncbi:MAG TPA: glycosyltransferase family 2 protein [Ktedonobacteraceae bacterium]|jgi:GT2 family glycosyltransferase|nr:glycosyltransferase family 2 protein [Ktedonobacteraceae bacterium]